MAKNDILGKSLWDAYSNKVTELMNNPKHQGEITEEEVLKNNNKLIVADFGAESCGDAVRLYWEVNPDNDVIVNSKFKSFGCFASNTNVNTPIGMKKISELSIGEKVITWNGKNITTNTIKDILIKEMNIDELQNTEFIRESGSTFKIITSKLHPFWGANNSMKIANEINIGDEMFELTEHELRVITNIRHQSDFRKKLSKQMKKLNKIINHSNLPQNQKGYQCKNPEEKQRKQSHKAKQLWKNPEYRKNWLNGMKNIDYSKPTKLEIEFLEFFLKHNIPIKYTAGKKWIQSKSGPISPDFIIEGKNKCVEVYTKKLPSFMQDRSDNSTYIEDRTKQLKEAGYNSLFLSIEELKNNYDETLIKTQKYVHNGIKVVNITEKIHANTLKTLKRNNDKILMYDLVLEENGNGHVYFTNRVASHNCGTAIASSDVMTELCLGKTVQEAVKITNIDVEFAMRDNPETPAVPPQKMHCSVMAYDVIKKAASIYMGVDAESFEEDIVVCECARVTLSTLQEVIKLNDLTTIEEITDYTKAGGFCKSCIKPGGHEAKEYYLVDILSDVRKEMEDEKMSIQANNIDLKFEDMSIVQKIKAIDKVIDDDIRQFLLMDGGNMEIIDIKEDKDKIEVFIRYLGACGSCSSSTTGTLFAIENALREKLSEKIMVLPI